MSLSSITKQAKRAKSRFARSVSYNPTKVGDLIICQRSSSSTMMNGPTVIRNWVELGIILAIHREGLAKSYRDGQGLIHIIDHDREQTWVVRDKAEAGVFWRECGGREWKTIDELRAFGLGALKAAGLRS